MLEIILQLLKNWEWLVILFFIGQFLKIICNVILKIYEIKATSKNTIKIGINQESKLVEITSSDISLEDIKSLNDKELLEFKKIS